MELEDMHRAYWTDEELEYHVTGQETDPHELLPTPGWYSCVVNWVCVHGNVEITLTCPDFKEVDITVLKKNIPIAFRKKPEQGEPPEQPFLDAPLNGNSGFSLLK